MRVCFLVPGLSPSGGIGVVREHARRLGEAHGVEAVVVDAADARAFGTHWDVAVATWWTTIGALGHVRAERRGVLAQGFDPLHYREDEFVDAIAATAAVAAPYDVIAVSDWVAECIRSVRPDAACRVVRPGIDPAVFGGGPERGGDGPLRVLVEGQPSVWFKGVHEALAACASMSRRPHVTLVAADPPSSADGADEVVGGLDAPAMAELYRTHDVMLKLSRHEGLGLAPLEGFHAGMPCVVTPYGGHQEYLRHGENGLLVGFDDPVGTARTLDRLDADRALLARLSSGALATAATWPDPAASTAALLDALRELGPGGDGVPELDAVLSRALPARPSLVRLRDELDNRERAIAHERARVDEVEGALRDLDAVLLERSTALEEAQRQVGAYGQAVEDLQAQLESTRSSRAYRFAASLRRLRPGGH